jgi:Protein similar to CwfJ C-terminus 2.
MIKKGLVEAAFKVEAENLKYPKFETTSNDELTQPGDSFRVWIWAPSETALDTDAAPSGEQDSSEKSLILPLGPDFRFDLQFGRRVMAKLLQLEKRINWKDDVQSKEEEMTDAESFKQAFKEFDFSLEE